MIYVIGSGPAGVSCATALLEQDLEVIMLDAGNELDLETSRAVHELRGLDPQQWRGERTNFLRTNMAPDRKGLGLKYAYGSDFPYRGVERLATIVQQYADTKPSLAKGGFSNVWGAAMLPYIDSDIDQWPITVEELAPHYRGVMANMDLAASVDDLAETFPLYTDRSQVLRRSRQADAMLNDLKRKKGELQSAGIHFGTSRLAVRAPSAGALPGCVYCGLCMYGCPYELIYNSALILPRLLQNRKFQYLPGIVVKRLQESAGEVKIEGTSVRDGSIIEFRAERVYLACGALSSTQIMLESLAAFDRPVKLMDSCYFLFPLARFRGTAKVGEESLHTLAQLFIEIMDSSVSPRTVHLQIYTYNDMYAAAVQKSLGPLYSLARLGLNSLLSRLLIVQGYLHSDLSPSIQLTLTRSSGAINRELVLQGEQTEASANTIRQVLKTLRRRWRALRAVPLSPLLNLPHPGRGFHSGGTFPMRNQPAEFESDVLGRPTGFRLVHMVDSSVFPSIPATTITFSVMANARRIASLHKTI